MRIGLTVFALILISGCELGRFDGIFYRRLTTPTVSATTEQVGTYVTVNLKVLATYDPTGYFPENTSAVTVGVAMSLVDGGSCQRSPPTGLPEGVKLDAGNTAVKKFDLIVKRGETIEFTHSFRFTTDSPKTVYMWGALWGKPDNPLSPGDPTDESEFDLSCYGMLGPGLNPIHFAVTFN